MTKLALAAMLALLGLATQAYANTQDGLTVTITPTASYSVTVTTTNVVLNLGSVGLNSSTQTVRPSTVTVTSSYAATGLKMAGQITGAGTPWTFAANTASIAGDELAAWAVFTDTSVASVTGLGGPGGNYFRGSAANTNMSNVVSTANNQVGTGAGNIQFIAAAGQAGYKTMASLPPSTTDLAASRAHLWLYFTLPPTTTDTNAKLVSLTITAGAPN